MAEHKTTAKRPSSGGKRGPAAKARQEAEERQRRHQMQLAALGLFAAGLFLFCICIIKGSNFWTVLHNSMYGLFGWCAWLVPISLVAIGVLASMDQCVVSHKLWQAGGLIALLCGATHAFALSDMQAENWWEAVVTLYQQGEKLHGGGLFSGLLGVPITALFGPVGARITIVLLIFVFFMIITGTTLHDFMRKAAKPVKRVEQAYLERMEERRAATVAAETANPVSGARFNIDVPIDEELPQHPVHSPKATMEYSDSMPMARDKLPGADAAPRGQAPRQKREKMALEDLVNKAMGLEANAFKPVYISDEDAERGAISGPNREGRFQFDPGAQEKPPQPPAGGLREDGVPMDFEEDPALEAQAEAQFSRPDEPPFDEAEPEQGSPFVQDMPVTPLEQTHAQEVLQQALEEIQPGPVSLPLEPEEELQQEEGAVEGRYQAKYIAEEDGSRNFDAYIYPPVSLLKEKKGEQGEDISEELKANAQRLVDTLNSFGVQTRIIDICRGPAVTRYELQPSAGVKISKITGLADDIALNLASAGVRIEAPIPNKPAVGIEVPNKSISMVGIREIIDSDVFLDAPSKLTVALGKDISGSITVTDLAKMPHLLIAGATGSGKSVCINSLIVSLLYKSTPDEVRLLMVDPKVVELGIYNGIPHLLVPVVTDPRKAAGALNWAVSEMLGRYKLFADNAVRDLKGYNKLARQEDNPLKPMPEIVIIIDELADLMMAAPNEVEDAVCRLAQMARAAGMHLVIATQRPSVDVITGVIKANIPSRIAFAVSSQVDSRTILDGSGAEKLLGRGDMLFMPVGSPKPTRVQGCYVSDSEVEKVVKFIKDCQTSEYDENIMSEIERQAAAEKGKGSGDGGGFDAEDAMLPKAIEVVVEAGQCSTSLLQRRLKLGYARAARIVDEMEQRGIVGPYEGSKPRTVLITRQQLIEMKMNSGGAQPAPEEIEANG